MTILVKRMHVLSTLKVELRVKNKPDNELKFPVTILKHSENIHNTNWCLPQMSNCKAAPANDQLGYSNPIHGKKHKQRKQETTVN